MKKVLIVDDDPENRAVVSEMIGGTFQTLTASGGKDGVRMAASEIPDLVLLDINMPDMNGFEVCRKLREAQVTRHIPVIILSTLSDMDSRVEGLNLGADDYITKPFHGRDLIARIQARLRRIELDLREEQPITFGNLSIDPKTMEATLDGKALKLTRVEFQIVRYFFEQPEKLIDRNVLLGDLWPDAVVTLRTVDTHIGNLRKKLRGFTGRIKTVYGSGYILKQAAAGEEEEEEA